MLDQLEAVRDLADLGAVLRQARQTAGLTQAQVRKATGVNRFTLSKLEGGKAADVSAERLFRLLRLYRLKLLVAPDAGLPTLAQVDFENTLQRRSESTATTERFPLNARGRLP